MAHRNLTPEMVAREWLAGASVAAMADRHDVGVTTIKQRLKKARTDHPDLPWDKRETVRSAPLPSPTRKYIAMTDGRTGGGTLPHGSVIPSRGIRKKGR